MENVFNKWQTRINHAEAELTSAFQFRNKKAPVVIADTNYWTFGDLYGEIPTDYYTEPSSAFRYNIFTLFII